MQPSFAAFVPQVRAILLAIALCTLGGRPVSAAPGDLIDSAQEGVNGVVGLNGARALAVSPDSKNLYVAALDGNAVSEFGVAPDGSLTFLGAVFDDTEGAESIALATDLAVSPDGAHVYVAGSGDNAIAVFSRGTDTGVLTFESAVVDGVGGTEGLASAAGVVVSSDGANVYAIGLADDTVVALSRDPESGNLAFVEAELDDATRPLDAPTDLALSPNDEQLYVVNFLGDSLMVFDRDASTGALTLVDTERNGVAGVTGLDAASAVVVSPDGRDVYVTGAAANSLAHFTRSPLDGTTTYVATLNDGAGGIDGLGAPFGMTITPDGRVVLVAAANDSGIGIFLRDPTTGALSYDGVLLEGVAANTLLLVNDVLVSPNGRWIAATAGGDDALTVFAPEPGATALGSATLAALALSRRRAQRKRRAFSR